MNLDIGNTTMTGKADSAAPDQTPEKKPLDIGQS